MSAPSSITSSFMTGIATHLVTEQGYSLRYQRTSGKPSLAECMNFIQWTKDHEDNQVPLLDTSTPWKIKILLTKIQEACPELLLCLCSLVLDYTSVSLTLDLSTFLNANNLTQTNFNLLRDAKISIHFKTVLLTCDDRSLFLRETFSLPGFPLKRIRKRKHFVCSEAKDTTFFAHRYEDSEINPPDPLLNEPQNLPTDCPLNNNLFQLNADWVEDQWVYKGLMLQEICLPNKQKEIPFHSPSLLKQMVAYFTHPGLLQEHLAQGTNKDAVQAFQQFKKFCISPMVMAEMEAKFSKLAAVPGMTLLV